MNQTELRTVGHTFSRNFIDKGDRGEEAGNLNYRSYYSYRISFAQFVEAGGPYRLPLHLPGQGEGAEADGTRAAGGEGLDKRGKDMIVSQ